MLDFMRPDSARRDGIRTINGEALRSPVQADLRGAGQVDPKSIPKDSRQAKVAAEDQGPCEEVDPIDAAIAITSGSGLKAWREACPDPSGSVRHPGSPQKLPRADCQLVEERYNRDKKLDGLGPNGRRKILEVSRYPDGTLQALVQESPDEARKRWQHEVSPKSFHGAIFGSAMNHRNVTAYDLAIGGGLASSDPKFYAYLCAVADWRLQMKANLKRPSILQWRNFTDEFSIYWSVEKPERKELIEGNATYYSDGKLPESVPALHTGLPSLVVCDTVAGDRVTASPAVPINSGNAKKGSR
jgi:hypothetical protein